MIVAIPFYYLIGIQQRIIQDLMFNPFSIYLYMGWLPKTKK